MPGWVSNACRYRDSRLRGCDGLAQVQQPQRLRSRVRLGRSAARAAGRASIPLNASCAAEGGGKDHHHGRRHGGDSRVRPWRFRNSSGRDRTSPRRAADHIDRGLQQACSATRVRARHRTSQEVCVKVSRRGSSERQAIGKPCAGFLPRLRLPREAGAAHQLNRGNGSAKQVKCRDKCGGRLSSCVNVVMQKTLQCGNDQQFERQASSPTPGPHGAERAGRRAR